MKGLLILFLVCAFVLIFISPVYAGILTSTTEQTTSGTRFSVFWSQGCGSNCRVEFLSGTLYGNRNLALGPNACNVGGLAGNNRAILCLAGSDASGPTTPDAVVNCNVCGCEDVPNTNFICQVSGACEQCNACPPNACPTGSTCTHLTCSTRTCTCDPVTCNRQDSWSSCEADDTTLNCGSAPGTRDRDVRSCDGNACVWSSQSESCTASLGSCNSGFTCINNKCAVYEPCALPGQVPCSCYTASNPVCAVSAAECPPLCCPTGEKWCDADNTCIPDAWPCP